MTALPPTDGEKKLYLDFVKDQIQKFGTTSRKDTLWHYTTGEGLIGIIQSAELWATQVSCANDASEIRYSERLALEALIEKRSNSTPTPDEMLLYDRAIAGLATSGAPT